MKKRYFHLSRPASKVQTENDISFARAVNFCSKPPASGINNVHEPQIYKRQCSLYVI